MGASDQKTGCCTTILNPQSTIQIPQFYAPQKPQFYGFMVLIQHPTVLWFKWVPQKCGNRKQVPKVPQYGTKFGTMCGALKKNYPIFSFSIDVSGG